MATATPDYEGNYYSDSDKDEPELETTTEQVEHKQGTDRRPFHARGRSILKCFGHGGGIGIVPLTRC
jgi:hypothetical protein